MKELHGPISTRLRALFGHKVEDWPAGRGDNIKRDMPEQHYTGQTLGARYRHVGEHRKEN